MSHQRAHLLPRAREGAGQWIQGQQAATHTARCERQWPTLQIQTLRFHQHPELLPEQ